MTENKVRKLRYIYAIVFSVITVIVGGLFIMQAWSIFVSQDASPYTVESISRHFSKIAIPVYLWLLALVGDIVLAFVFPETEVKPKPYIPLNTALDRLKNRLPSEDLKLVRKGEDARFIWGLITAAVCAACAAACLILLFDKSYTNWLKSEFFTQHGGVADRLVLCSFLVLAAFIVCTVAAVVCEKSKKKQITILKTAVAENAKKGVKAEKREKQLTFTEKSYKKYPILRSDKWLLGVRIGLCVAGLALFVFGIYNGGITDVYEKAKNICTQCIGLG